MSTTPLEFILKKNSVGILIFIIPECSFCTRLVNSLKKKRLEFKTINVSECSKDFLDSLKKKTGCATVPQVFYNGKFVSDYSNFFDLRKKNLNFM